MNRTIEYRGFEVHIELSVMSQDMFDVWFRIDGPMPPVGEAAIGVPIQQVRHGPYLLRCGLI